MQVKCKPLPNGKIAAASKHKAGAISRKSSTEEKERGRDREREKEESNDKEEKKEEDTSEEGRAEEQAFLVDLYKYMKDRDTPIERIPFLGFKQSEYAFFLLPPAVEARAGLFQSRFCVRFKVIDVHPSPRLEPLHKT